MQLLKNIKYHNLFYMKKILLTLLILFNSTSGFAFNNIKLLEKIDLHLDADIETVITSAKNYVKDDCNVIYTKQGSYAPTTAYLDFNGNLDNFLVFLRKHKKSLHILCFETKYDFKSIDNEMINTDIYLSLETCGRKVTSIEINTTLREKLYGKKPDIVKTWESLFYKFSNKKPEIENYEDEYSSLDGKKYKQINEKIKWKDIKDDIVFFIIKHHSYEERYGTDSYSAKNDIRISIANTKKIAHCYLYNN